MSLDWKQEIKDKETFDVLVKTGMMWEIFPDCPLSWKECEEVVEKEKQRESD